MLQVSYHDQTKNMVVEEVSKYTYPTQLTNSFDRENWTVSTDHCYARPWNWRPDASFLRPTKTLFVRKLIPQKRKSINPVDVDDTIIDVVIDPESPTPLYDEKKARIMMEELEKYAFSSRKENDETWDETISKVNWTTSQHKVFNAMVNILDSFNLAKLTQLGVHNESLMRRNLIDKSVQRVRRLLASVLWEPKITQWIHQLLIDHLGPNYLACYLDILQTLKSKLPAFVDKMMYSPNSSLRMGALNNANLTPLLEKKWDPLAASLMQDKPKKLPGNPLIVIMPTGPIMSKMIQKWTKLLSHLATVVTVPTNFGMVSKAEAGSTKADSSNFPRVTAWNQDILVFDSLGIQIHVLLGVLFEEFIQQGSTGHRMAMPSILDQLFSVTRGKIQDVREDYPGRNIILVGFNSGASIAIQLAQVESVMCVISIGFSLLTAEGRRGEPDDNILELQCPVLFVVGQCSNTSSQEDLEELRERMRVETGLIVVGSADDYLRVSKKKKNAEGITQSVIDRCIVDEIGEFISGIILSPYPPKVRQSPTHVLPLEIPVKKCKIERKRYNSNTSSLDSEPPSPKPRTTRPVGRPPGSKSKNRLGLEAKWAQQIAQGNTTTTNLSSPSPSPPPPYPSIPTPDTSSTDSCHTDNNNKLQQQSKTTTTEPNVKKIKTLKPIIVNQDKSTTVSTSPVVKNVTTILPARMQAYGLNRPLVQGSSSNVSTLLQGGIKTIPPTQPKPSSSSGIKVLENVTLDSTTTAKLVQNRTIDLSKITLINSVKDAQQPSMNNVLLLPDGKLKSIHGGSSIRGTGATPILLPLSPQKGTPKPNRTKFITAKRQLANQKPPRPIKNPLYAHSASTLPPPKNLTTEDIMDLPIIFADDDSQMLDTTTATTILPPDNLSTTRGTPSIVAKFSPSSSTTAAPKLIQSLVTPAKYMLINKPSTTQSNFIFTPGSNRKPNLVTFNKPTTPKYTKIILSSKKPNVEEMKTTNSKIQCLSPEITVKKVSSSQGHVSREEPPPVVELIDLENEIQATAVPKPNLSTSDIKNIKIVPKNVVGERFEMAFGKGSERLVVTKRSSLALDGTDGDPDYIPPNKLKLE